MEPYASVIIPSHDRAATLPVAVASVQRQTVSNIEILVVGDGATPEVVAVAEALSGADSRVRFLALDKAPRDGGINVDRAVHAARSERIFYNDDDDVWLPQHIESIGPNLDHAHIADTLPVSVGTIPVASCQRLHGTLVNGGNSRIRRLLAEDRLKLTFDTHIAHRKSSYIELGSPWVTQSGYAVSHMLGTFADARWVRWRTLPTATALSLHGAARVAAKPEERRTEIEAWFARSASWTPDLLLQRLDFTWHLVRMLFAEPPLVEDGVADYLARHGSTWDEAALSRVDAYGSPLTVVMNERQRRAVQLAFALFQGRIEADQRALDPLLLALLDRVLGGAISVEYPLRMLRPHGASTALEICSRLRSLCPADSYLVDLLEAYIMLDARTVIAARGRATRLAADGRLPPDDLARLLVRCDLGEGALDAAIRRLQRAWQPKTSPVAVGLELASSLMAAARAPEAIAVCTELRARAPGHPLLLQMSTTLGHMVAALGAVPAYRWSRDALLDPDGRHARLTDHVTGHVDGLHIEDGLAYISGWAVDLKSQQPASRVIAIARGRACGVAGPTIRRSDVAAALQLPMVEVSGFLLAARLPPRQTDVRVFAITAEGAAGELKGPSAPAPSSPV